MAKETDNKILDLIKLSKEKKDAISKVEKSSWKTNCSFAYEPESSARINIQTVSDVNVLVSIVAHLMYKHDFFDQACELLSVNQVFKWMGFSCDDWISDIKTRINKIQISKEKSELASIENRLGALISPELRAELELKELESMLSK